MDLVLVALAAMFVTEFVKQLLPFPVMAWVKSLIALLVAGSMAAWLRVDVPTALAGAGLAVLLHEAQAALALLCDWLKQAIILRHGTRRR